MVCHFCLQGEALEMLKTWVFVTKPFRFGNNWQLRNMENLHHGLPLLFPSGNIGGAEHLGFCYKTVWIWKQLAAAQPGKFTSLLQILSLPPSLFFFWIWRRTCLAFAGLPPGFYQSSDRCAELRSMFLFVILRNPVRFVVVGLASCLSFRLSPSTSINSLYLDCEHEGRSVHDSCTLCKTLEPFRQQLNGWLTWTFSSSLFFFSL